MRSRQPCSSCWRVRLTDAPEADASRARDALQAALDAAALEAAAFSGALAGYYDDQVCALVARLEGEEPPWLAQDPAWRLWLPIDPSRPRRRCASCPRTVVWLNETQFYLDVADGEQVAAGLRELLRDPARGPVLVLATLWPEFWNRLTARPPAGDEDPHAQARELLTGRDITVPAAFTPAQVRQLTTAGNPLLEPCARPVAVRPPNVTAGQRVRIRVLDAGPSGDSSFHVVGAQFTTVFNNGAYLLQPGPAVRPCCDST